MMGTQEFKKPPPPPPPKGKKMNTLESMFSHLIGWRAGGIFFIFPLFPTCSFKVPNVFP